MSGGSGSLSVVVLVLLTAAVCAWRIHALVEERASRLVRVSAWCTWLISGLSLILLPLDLTADATLTTTSTSSFDSPPGASPLSAEGIAFSSGIDERSACESLPTTPIGFLWHALFLGYLVFSFLINEALAALCLSGGFSSNRAVCLAVRIEARYYAMLILASGALVLALAASGRLDAPTLLGWAVAASNTWGVFLYMATVAFALIELPRHLWSLSHASSRLRWLACTRRERARELHAATALWREAAHEASAAVMALSRALSTNAGGAPTLRRHHKELLHQREEMLSCALVVEHELQAAAPAQPELDEEEAKAERHSARLLENFESAGGAPRKNKARQEKGGENSHLLLDAQLSLDAQLPHDAQLASDVECPHVHDDLDGETEYEPPTLPPPTLPPPALPPPTLPPPTLPPPTLPPPPPRSLSMPPSPSALASPLALPPSPSEPPPPPPLAPSLTLESLESLRVRGRLLRLRMQHAGYAYERACSRDRWWRAAVRDSRRGPRGEWLSDYLASAARAATVRAVLGSQRLLLRAAAALSVVMGGLLVWGELGLLFQWLLRMRRAVGPPRTPEGNVPDLEVYLEGLLEPLLVGNSLLAFAQREDNWLLLLVPLVWLRLCIGWSLSRMRGGAFALRSNRSTDSASLLYDATVKCQLTMSLCFNFVVLVQRTDDIDRRGEWVSTRATPSAVFCLYASKNQLSIFGHRTDDYYPPLCPALLLILSLLLGYDVYSRLLGVFGLVPKSILSHGGDDLDDPSRLSTRFSTPQSRFSGGDGSSRGGGGGGGGRRRPEPACVLG